jgi:hypothetical protein
MDGSAFSGLYKTLCLMAVFVVIVVIGASIGIYHLGKHFGRSEVVIEAPYHECSHEEAR